MITVYGAGAQLGLPELSPFVTKTEAQLKMAGLAYRKQQSAPQASPKGQLPFIDDDGEVVADSTFIRAHIERKYGIDLDAGLDARERAQAWTIERMVENHLGGAFAYSRFLIPENFEKGPGRWFDQAPEEKRAELRADLLQRVTEALRINGVARHAPEEVVERCDRSLKALSLLVGDKPHAMGENPCGLDATAFGMLAGVMTPALESPLRRRALGYANLVAYVDRLMRRFYPEHHWPALAT